MATFSLKAVCMGLPAHPHEVSKQTLERNLRGTGGYHHIEELPENKVLGVAESNCFTSHSQWQISSFID